MRRMVFGAALGVATWVPGLTSAEVVPPLIDGFTPATTGEERAVEKSFDAQLNPADLRAWLEQMSDEANHVGTPKDRANAEFMARQFRAWGFDTHIETFDCLYPTPISHAVEMVA